MKKTGNPRCGLDCHTVKVEDGAEREGFEPPTPCGIRDFESRAFVHSAISPCNMDVGYWEWTLDLSISLITVPLSR